MPGTGQPGRQTAAGHSGGGPSRPIFLAPNWDTLCLRSTGITIAAHTNTAIK